MPRTTFACRNSRRNEKSKGSSRGNRKKVWTSKIKLTWFSRDYWRVTIRRDNRKKMP